MYISQYQVKLFPFINFFLDYSVASDDLVDSFTDELIERYRKGENLLLHCRGGHGRAGTIAAILLGKMYNISSWEALKRVQTYHDCRPVKSFAMSPQVSSQFDQVIRIIDKKRF